jgi:Pentapeptide repeats (9 copies)
VIHATFTSGVQFRGARFGPRVVFTACDFRSSCDFSWVSTAEDFQFRDNRVDGEATFASLQTSRTGEFDQSVFFEDVTFANAHFSNAAVFYKTQFARKAAFENCAFVGHAHRFDGARFAEPVAFDGAAFSGETSFDGLLYPQFGAADFARGVQFDGARCNGELGLRGVEFRENFGFDDVEVHRVAFDGATFHRPQSWGLVAEELDLSMTFFEQGGLIEVADAEVTLDESRAGAPLLITANSAGGHPPRIVSIARARAEALVFGNADLSQCNFFGAHQLERMRIEPSATFADVKRPYLTRRSAICEELQWRRVHQPRRWSAVADGLGLPHADELLAPAAVSSVYRALRKAREDAGDAPGAADFYYGEMEMRRLDRNRSLSERAIVGAYWAFAGYGLRASRALLGLILVIALGSVVMWRVGFHHRPTFAHAGRTAVESTSSLFRLQSESTTGLSHWGVLTEWSLRWLGPLFIALAILSMRGRVKR